MTPAYPIIACDFRLSTPQKAAAPRLRALTEALKRHKITNQCIKGENIDMSAKETVKRYVLFIISLFFAALGVAVTKRGELGVSPISSVANIMSSRFEGLTLGTWLILWNVVLILGQILLLLGFGVSLSVIADVIMNSGEAFVKAVADRTGKNFGNVKIAFDVCCVAAAVALSLLLFGGRVVGTREGTVATALLTGLVVKFFVRRLSRPLTAVLAA